MIIVNWEIGDSSHGGTSPRALILGQPTKRSKRPRRTMTAKTKAVNPPRTPFSWSVHAWASVMKRCRRINLWVTSITQNDENQIAHLDVQVDKRGTLDGWFDWGPVGGQMGKNRWGAHFDLAEFALLEFHPWVTTRPMASLWWFPLRFCCLAFRRWRPKIGPKQGLAGRVGDMYGWGV